MKTLKKAEFDERIRAWAARRYGLALPEDWIDDLIREGLIPEALRAENDGLAPLYVYDRISYRLALQIARLRRDGFIRRNAIRVQLFLRGYSVSIRDVRSAVWPEYRNLATHLSAQVRSRYIDNYRDIPDKQKERLGRSLGPLDPRLKDAGYKLEDNVYISMLRDAKQKPVDFDDKSFDAALRMMSSGDFRYSALANALRYLFRGLLITESVEVGPTEKDDYLQAIIGGASHKEYLSAREYFRVITSRHFADACDLIETGGTARDRMVAIEAVRSSVKGDAGWSVSILVQGLFLAHQGQTTLTEQKVQALAALLDEKSLSLKDALASVLANRGGSIDL